MFKRMFSIKITLLSCLVVVATMVVQGQVTRMGFYASTCPQAEAVVRATVESHFRADPSIAPGLLRMHFHDCFVRGCDGSILVDGVDTEKTARPNLPLRGFDVIADAKKQLEDECPGVVSCADVLALAARDSVVLNGGQSWEVPTGRRDGRVSMASDFANFPSFRDSVAVQIQKFSELGLTTEDLVTLVGGHTIGTAACRTFAYRIYNFSSTGRPDPSINSTFLPQLRKLCPQIGGSDRRVVLDAGRHPDQFDTSFFENLRTGQGILESDQALWANTITRSIVGRFLDDDAAGLRFGFEFAKAMVKMGNLGVKNGSVGEIRKVCSAIN